MNEHDEDQREAVQQLGRCHHADGIQASETVISTFVTVPDVQLDLDASARAWSLIGPPSAVVARRRRARRPPPPPAGVACSVAAVQAVWRVKVCWGKVPHVQTGSSCTC
eukprot:COSAG02_NODE_1396_length_12898_cov_23.802953_5_plen_109_part_00